MRAGAQDQERQPDPDQAPQQQPDDWIDHDDDDAPASGVFWDIVEESLDEAEFLWRRREAALAAHDRTPADVEDRIEDRWLGAIEGLCAPSTAAVRRVLAPALQSEDPAVVTVAAFALLTEATVEGITCFREAFLGGAGSRLASLRRALELVPASTFLAELAPAVRTAPDPVRAAFLDACFFRGLSLEPQLGELLACADPELQRAAARMLGVVSPADRARWLPRALELNDSPAREAAVIAGLIAGTRAAWTACRALATADLHPSAAMLVPLAMSGARRDHDQVVGALARPQRQRGALWALGFGGWRSGADACVEMLAQDRHALLAAEALVAITGLDLCGAGLAAAAPSSTPTGPSGQGAGDNDNIPAFEDEDLDAELVPTAEDNLPAPDVPGVIRWWNRNRARFDPDTRYLGGRATGIGVVVDALAHGPMRRRPMLAFELAVRTQGRFQLQTGGLLRDQRRRLVTFAARGFDPGRSHPGAPDACEEPRRQETSTRARR
jgi:uncharacterized protein (TIGR02270 family)